MVKDHFSSLENIKNIRMERFNKEARLVDKQKKLSLAYSSKPSISAKNISATSILTKLQNKFSGREQEMTNYIEAEVQSRTEELYRKANFDALTHLPNRLYFKELIAQIILRAKDNQSQFTLLFLDIDGFKNVNDSFGHHIGDELLKHVAARLVSAVRENDIVARLGGDELVVLLTGDDDSKATIKAINDRIIDDISQPYYLEKNEVKVSTSIGIGTYPQDGTTGPELMKNADAALYIAKTKGKKQYRFYADIESINNNQQASILAIDEAIQQNKLFTCVQPQIDFTTNKIVGASIEPHWQSTWFTGSSWGNWKHLLAKSNNKVMVSRWLFDSACFYLQQWQKINPQFVITVEIADLLVNTPNLAKYLTERIEQFKVSKNQLQLAASLAELTAEKVSCLQQLIAEGFQITLTELGAEKLDFNLLAGLNIQEFRFNGQWLQQQIKSKQGQQWLQALIQMVKSLDASIIATEVVDELSYKQLKSWGCEIGQGSFWSKEINSEQFREVLNN